MSVLSMTDGGNPRGRGGGGGGGRGRGPLRHLYGGSVLVHVSTSTFYLDGLTFSSEEKS